MTCLWQSSFSLAFPGSKESSCNAGDAGLIPGLGRSPEKEMATHSSILAWEIPWTEELAGYSPWGLKESDMISDQARTHTSDWRLTL